METPVNLDSAKMKVFGQWRKAWVDENNMVLWQVGVI